MAISPTTNPLTSQNGDTYHTFDIPAYGLLDAALFYGRERFRAQVNFNNILDRRHFVGSCNDLYVLPVKALWSLIALVPGILAVTGFHIWQRRRASRRRPAARIPDVAPAAETPAK